MITIIMLTCIAVIVLLIGFFEIRIPFIHKASLNKRKRGEFLEPGLGNEAKISKKRNIKSFLRTAKNENCYRFVRNRNTSDIV